MAERLSHGARRIPPLALLLVLVALGGCKGKERRAEALADRGVAHGRSGELGRALEAFDAALALDPKNLKALYNSGIALLGAGRGAAAAARFSGFVALRPDDALGHFYLARAQLREQRDEAAIASLARAVELGFDDWVEWRAASDLEALAGDFRFAQMEVLVAQRAGVAPPELRPGEGYVNRPMPKLNQPGRQAPRCAGAQGEAIACAE